MAESALEDDPLERDSTPTSEKVDESAAIQTDAKTTFKELGLLDSLCQACDKLKFSNPTEIQEQAIPYALQGRDIIGLAQTGSGKTAAFALPILHALWARPQGLFACVLAPTRELAQQIAETFEALGAGIGVKCALIIGQSDMVRP